MLGIFFNWVFVCNWNFYLSSTFCRNTPNIEMDKKTFLVNCDRAVEYLNSLEGSSERCFWHLTSFILLQLSLRILLKIVCQLMPFSTFLYAITIFLSISVFYTIWFLLVQFHNFHSLDLHVPPGVCQWSVLELGSRELHQSLHHISLSIPFPLHAQQVSKIQTETPSA